MVSAMASARGGSLASSIRAFLCLRGRIRWTVLERLFESEGDLKRATFTVFDEKRVGEDISKLIKDTEGLHDVQPSLRFSRILLGPWYKSLAATSFFSALLIFFVFTDFFTALVTAVANIALTYIFCRPVVVEYVEIGVEEAEEVASGRQRQTMIAQNDRFRVQSPSQSPPQPLPRQYFERVSVRADGSLWVNKTGRQKVHNYILIEAFMGCSVEWTLLATVEVEGGGGGG